MLRYITAFIITVLSVVVLHAQPQPPKIDTSGPDVIYRHFTGRIGERNAVLDLRYRYSDASNFGGSTCYFTDEGIYDFFLISKPNTISHTETLRAQAFPETIALKDIKNAYSIFVQTARFDFDLRADSLNGHWVTPNGQLTQMMLTESYTDALQFDCESTHDSIAIDDHGHKPLRASASYTGIVYTKNIKADVRSFINKALAKFLGGKRASGSGDLSQICIKAFLDDYMSTPANELEGQNITAQFTLFPVYNESGFLVLQKGGYQYDFKNKEYTDRNLYLNLDIKNKKTLALSDVITVNKEVLLPILEKAFRKKYQLPADKKLGDVFLGETMPFTDNFILSGKGITFSYSPAKLFRDSEDISDLQEMRIFIPYDELNSLLVPGFRMRIGR
jgi:hypothetical protein